MRMTSKTIVMRMMRAERTSNSGERPAQVWPIKVLESVREGRRKELLEFLLTRPSQSGWIAYWIGREVRTPDEQFQKRTIETYRLEDSREVACRLESPPRRLVFYAVQGNYILGSVYLYRHRPGPEITAKDTAGHE
jgi:hypothetical protein